ncbi:MAG: type IV secretion system protein [Magnetospirillum sp.]|nr:type IV secretion system protein [Magnetospirillum sp.]
MDKYVQLTGDFADKLGEALQEPMLMLFASLAGLWIVLSGIKLALRMTDKGKIIQDFVFITITGILLGSQGKTLVPIVYTSAISIMSGASASVFSIGGGAISSSEHTGIAALAASGEQAVVKVFQAGVAISQAGSLANIMNYAYAFILVLPYLLLVVAYASQVTVAIFRATMAGVFAPFLFMAFAFGWGRDMAKSGAKSLLAAILVLFACTAALALTIYGVVNMPALDPTRFGDNDELNEFASITNPEFLVIMFLGWAGTALMTEGTSIANSIAQTALTNAAAGIMTAGVTGSALWAGKKTGQGIMGEDGIGGVAAAGMKAAGGKALFGVGYGAAAAAHHAGQLLDKFKNINQPRDGGG